MNGVSMAAVGLIAGVMIGVVGLMIYQSATGTVVTPPPTTEQAINQASQTTESLAQTVTDAATAEWKVTLGEQNESGRAGFATLKDKDGQVQVLLALASAPGASVSAAQPAHIHLGECPNPGEVKYPLNDVVDGTSETMVPTTIAQLKESLPLAINVHQSAVQIQKYIACGDLK